MKGDKRGNPVSAHTPTGRFDLVRQAVPRREVVAGWGQANPRAGAGTRAGSASRVEAMNMTRTFTAQDGSLTPGRAVRPVTWRARAFVLGGLAVAAVYTAAALGLDAGAEHVGPLWTAAIAWTVVASLAGALWRGFRHHDWSAFSSYELPEVGGETHEFALRIGPYSWLREMEDQLLHDDDHLR